MNKSRITVVNWAPIGCIGEFGRAHKADEPSSHDRAINIPRLEASKAYRQ